MLLKQLDWNVVMAVDQRSFSGRARSRRAVILAATVTWSLAQPVFGQADLIFKDGFESGPRLVINEVDYDQIGTDTGEFVEIFNAGTTPVALDGLHLLLFNGADSGQYGDIDLAVIGTLPAGEYLVVASPTVMVAPGAHVIRFALASNNIQNGPDGLLLVDTVSCSVLDALSYEGSITAVQVAGCGTVSLVEGTPLPAGVADSSTAPGSLIRNPSGSDTDNAATDWTFTATPTPGLPPAP